MKKTLYLTLILVVFAFNSFGQKLAKPTLTSKPLTAAQEKTLKEGVALHDAKNYDAAIEKYQSILADNPDAAGVIYELSLSLNTKGEKEKAMEMATRGSKYICDELPLFYTLMANNLDDLGKSKEAIKIYLEGLKLLEGDTRFGTYRSSLYFNLGVTYVKQKMYNDARQALKSAVENDYGYASPHFLLSAVYNGTKYNIPAFLAASRFISVEYNTNRSGGAATTIVDILKPAPKDPKTGNTVINLDFGAPTDEGDFGSVNILLPMLGVAKDDKDKNKSKNELFVETIDTVISLLAEDKKLASTFVGRNYIPFMVEMKKKGYVEIFGYMVTYISGDHSAETWLAANDDKLVAYLAWAKAYRPPAK